METIRGKIQCRTFNAGSKSEGMRAVLTDSDGNEYMLYRAGVYPVNDKYFLDMDGMDVSVTGEKEDSGDFCVSSAVPADTGMQKMYRIRYRNRKYLKKVLDRVRKKL